MNTRYAIPEYLTFVLFSVVGITIYR